MSILPVIFDPISDAVRLDAMGSASVWWPPGKSFAYDLSNNRYMRNGGASTQALSLEETRASSAWVLQANGTYKEVAAGELATGQGVGGQFSQAVTNLFDSPEDLTDAAWSKTGSLTVTLEALDNPAGFPHVSRLERTGTGYPFIRQGKAVVAGTDYTIAAVVEKTNHRYAGLRCFQDGVANPYTVFDFDTETFTAVAPENSAPGFLHLYDNWYLIWVRGTPATSATLHASLTLSDLTGGTLPSTHAVLGVPIGASMHVLWADVIEGAFIPPHVVGTRAADGPVVVQGLGDELITGDRDDFTVSTDYDSSTVTADQLGDADLVDLPGVNSRTLFRPVVALVAGVKARWEIQLRSVAGTGTWPLAAYDGTDRVGERLVELTEEWSTHHIEMVVTNPNGLPGIYLGDRRDVIGETLFQAYVRQGSVKQVFPYPGYNITGVVSGHELGEGGGFDGVLDAAWVPGGTGAYTVETEDGALKVIGNAYASQQLATVAGRVHRFSTAILEAQGSSNEIRVGNSPGAFEVARSATTLDVGSHELFWLAPDNFSYVALKTHYAGSSLDETLFDNASNQEVEPGVVFEVKAKWGATIGQHAFRFDEGASANTILVQQTGLGTTKLLVRAAGVDVINFASAVLWPSDTEATFRLEITKTDAGTFFALFLDDVYIDDIPAVPVDYPEAINQLKLAPVEGVSVIKQVYGK